MFVIAANQQERDQMKVESRQAHTLFGVVFLFFVGHTLRICLNMEELFVSRATPEYKLRNEDCGSPIPFWALVSCHSLQLHPYNSITFCKGRKYNVNSGTPFMPEKLRKCQQIMMTRHFF